MEKTIPILTWNLANGVFEESEMDGKFRFGLRFDSIVRNLVEWRAKYDLKVIALQEVKGCLGPDGKSRLTTSGIAERLASELKMKYTIQGNTKNPKWIYKMLLYDDSLFELDVEDTLWMPRTAIEDEWINVHGTRLAFKTHTFRKGKKITFWHCHPNPDLSTRMEYFRKLIDYLDSKKYVSPQIVLGNFNTLTRNKKEQEEMLSKHFAFLTNDVKETYCGFEYDTDEEGQPHRGKLDHVMVRPSPRKPCVSSKNVFTLDPQGMSDHYPLFCTLVLSRKGPSQAWID